MTSIHLRCLSVLTLQFLHWACRVTATTYEHRTYELLVTLDRNKATWPGPALILKPYASVFASTLQFVFPQSLKLNILSKHWLIFKKGGRKDLPISLTSIVCNIFEHLIHKHIMNHNNFTFSQPGFRSKLSCETHLIRTHHDTERQLDRRDTKRVDAILLDFTEAKVPHRKLALKLRY